MDINEIRVKRLNAAILKSGYSYAELEKLTGFSKSSIQRYATGVTKKIPIDFITKIAEITNSNVRYLMGWEDDNVNNFEGIIKRIIEEKNISLQQLSNDSGLSVKFLDDWLYKQCSYATWAQLEDTVKALGVPIEEVISQIPAVAALGLDSINEEWDKESEKFEKEAEYRYKALDKALIPYVPDPKERGMATSIVQQFPRLNLNGLMMLNNRIEELVRFDECISDIEKESRSAGH